MVKKRGKIFLISGIVILIALVLPFIAKITGDVTTTATVSLTILSAEHENVSHFGIFEPLCCTGGTGDYCLDNNLFNQTTLSGDVYCEGSQAGQNIAVNVQHVLKFNFTSITISSASGDYLGCVVEQSDGSYLFVNESGLNLTSQDYVMDYAISNNSIITRDEDSSIHDLPWGVHNCSIFYGNGSTSNTDLKDVIFVHRNLKWDTFDYQKAVFAESVPYKFFNNTRALDKYYIQTDNKSYTRYLSFKHLAGSETEEFCFDGDDNDNDGNADYDDEDCRTFTHRYNVSDINFTLPNFLSFLGLFNGLFEKEAPATGLATSSDTDNIVIDSLGNANYWFTKNNDLDGSFKFRIYETSPGSSGYGYTVKNFPNVSSIALTGIIPSGYQFSYACGATASQPETVCNINFDCSSCGSGLVDAVLIINSSYAEFDGSVSMDLETVHGTSILEESFTAYFDAEDGLNNTFENETSSATDSNLCDDGINNDLDVSLNYNYITGLASINNISYSRDCADVDCQGINGPSYTAEQDYTFSQGVCNYRTETSCNDGYDNDFNDNYSTDAYGLQGIFYTDCHDIDCFGNGVECPTSETVCNDGVNNDFDYVDTNSSTSSGHKIGNTNSTGGTTWNNLKFDHTNLTDNLLDCEDFDCNGSIGGSSGELCTWGHELNCSDSFNNDALQTYDCVFSGTYGTINGQEPSFAHAEYDCSVFCQATVDNAENGSQCDDGYDNDFDYWNATGFYAGTQNGGIDCGWNGTGKDYTPDDDCHLEVMGNGYTCELGEEVTCNDSFDNDYDDGFTTSGGWNSTLYNDYFSQFGMTYSSNADCDDYSCQGVGNCLSTENAGSNDAFCFDGADNDLDGDFDCSDTDCIGVINPDNSSQVCRPYEFNITLVTDNDPNTTSTNFCGDNVDNEDKEDDNNASTAFGFNSIQFTYTGANTYKLDCNDLDCRNNFGACGPCSSYEFVEWNSCFDSQDNDHDGSTDTSDSDCDGKIVDERGYNSTASPSTEVSCSNGFDDDGDGDTDCSDSDCTGLVFSSDGRVCGALEAGTETSCNDDFDNDEDGALDCYDSDCSASCGFTAISGSGLTYNPSNASFSLTGDVTISGTASEVVRKGEDLYISYSYSGGSLGGVTIVLGSFATSEVINTSIFNVSAVSFTSNPDSFSLDSSTAGNGYLTFTHSSISSFSFTVKIPGKGVLAEAFTVKSTAEVGTNTAEGSFDVEVVNNETPEIGAITLEPSDGNLSANDKLQVVIGNFTGVSGGQSNSGAAGRCQIVISGPNGFSLSEFRNNCKSSNSGGYQINSSGTYTVQATIYDNTGNQGNTLIDSVYLSVAPSISLGLSRSSSKRVFFATGNSSYDSFDDSFNSIDGTMVASFVTDQENPFTSTSCEAIIRDYNGNIISTQAISGTLAANDNQINCQVDGDLTGISSDGLYRVSVNATDSNGNSLETSDLAFFVCDDLTSSSINQGWNCSVADFDVDGYTEGLNLPFNFSSDGATFYSPVCDSCPSGTNTGRDSDGDGYDNFCDPTCGDGAKEGNEQCDDGNTANGDGCSSTCTVEVSAGGGGGGGGGAITQENILEFVSISPDPLNIELKQGETKTTQLKIQNFLNKTISVKVDDYSYFESFMLIDSSPIQISPGDTGIINVEAFAGIDELPESYAGSIVLNLDGTRYYLNTLLQIIASEPLFDLTTTVIFKNVIPGGNVTAEINMTNVGNPGSVDAILYYSILDFNDTTIDFGEENLTIVDSLNLERTLNLPEDVSNGNYVFFSRLSYEGGFATSSDTFRVTDIGNKLLLLLIIILILVIIGVLVVLYMKYANRNKLYKKASSGQ